MSKELVCPFCQQELHKDSDGYYTCYTDNCECMKYGGNGASGSESLWLALIRTRRALAFAKSKLNGIHRLYSKAFYTREDWLQVCMEMVDKANAALEQITALEQKDK